MSVSGTCPVSQVLQDRFVLFLDAILPCGLQLFILQGRRSWMVPCVFLYCHLGSAAPGRVLMAYAEVGQAIFQSIGVSTIYVQLYSRSTWTGMFFLPPSGCTWSFGAYRYWPVVHPSISPCFMWCCSCSISNHAGIASARSAMLAFGCCAHLLLSVDIPLNWVCQVLWFLLSMILAIYPPGRVCSFTVHAGISSRLAGYE